MKLAVITVSSAYFTQDVLHHDDLFILEIPIYIDGESYVESHQWFNAEYIVSHILVPTILAIITTLITLTLTNALSPSQQTIQEFHTQQELHSPEEMP